MICFRSPAAGPSRHGSPLAAADGIVQLSRHRLGSRDERYFRVIKLRGSRYLEGSHTFGISDAGLEVHPRLVSPLVHVDYEPIGERVSTGIPELDAMTSGGFWRGSSTLLAGPSGSGKTTLALQFALDGPRRGEPSLYVNFQENPNQLARTIGGLGVNLEEMRECGLDLLYASPVELQIDSIVKEMFSAMVDHWPRKRRGGLKNLSRLLAYPGYAARNMVSVARALRRRSPSHPLE